METIRFLQQGRDRSLELGALMCRQAFVASVGMLGKEDAPALDVKWFHGAQDADGAGGRIPAATSPSEPRSITGSNGGNSALSTRTASLSR